jgi:23S rRNA (guanosine2251-2'-O)-methyltransferase
VVTKAAAGATEVVPLARETNLVQALDVLKKAGFWVYGLEAEAETSLADADLSGNVVVVLGSEGAGLRRLVREHCDHLAHLSAHGPIASLNVAQACAVALYEVFRRRG